MHTLQSIAEHKAYQKQLAANTNFLSYKKKKKKKKKNKILINFKNYI